MTQYLSTVLRSLERVYRFRSSQRTAPDELELDVPIQVVHDVSRMAQYGTGVGPKNFGFWIAAFQNVHTVTGNLTGTMQLDNPTNSLNGYPDTFSADDFQAWIMRAWMDSTDTGDMAGAQVIMGHSASSIGPTGVAGVIANDIVVMGDGSAPAANADGSGRTIIQNSEPSNWFHRPVPLLQKEDGSAALMKFTSTADGAGTVTVDFNVLFWLGRKGATPPGFG